MSLARVHTWIAAEVLTASDLNAEFNNIIVNASSLFSPFTADTSTAGFKLYFDAGNSIYLNAVTNGLSLVGGAFNTPQGADIASAATVNLDTATGNVVDVTGTASITAITLSQGRTRIVRFTGVLTLTHGASLVLPGAQSIVTTAGDYAIFVGYASSVVRCIHYSPPIRISTAAQWAVSSGTADAITTNYTPPNVALTDGMLCAVRPQLTNATTTPTFSPDGLTAHTITKMGGAALGLGDLVTQYECLLRYNLGATRWEFLNPPTIVATQAEQETSTSVAKYVSPGRQQFHPSAAKGWVQFDAAVNIGSSYNVSGMTDNGVGSWTISWNVDFSSANFTALGTVQQSQGGAATTLCLQIATAGLTAGTTSLLLTDVATTARDATFIHCAAFGDQ